MKTATFYAVLAIVVSFGINAYGQQPCNGGNGGLPGVEPGLPFPPIAAPAFIPPLGPAATNSAVPVPVAQIRLTPSNPATQPVPSESSLAPSARISVVAAKPEMNHSSPLEPETEESLDPELKGLVGKWSAVSRFGEGELSTVELQLDDRGWATLTVPTKDGQRSTIKRRIQLDDKELKLTGPNEKALSLGKLIDVNDRQMVLERASGQVTFVRM